MQRPLERPANPHILLLSTNPTYHVLHIALLTGPALLSVRDGTPVSEHLLFVKLQVTCFYLENYF